MARLPRTKPCEFYTCLHCGLRLRLMVDFLWVGRLILFPTLFFNFLYPFCRRSLPTHLLLFVGIVISSSASPTEGTSSDSCLTSSANDGSVALSNCLEDQMMLGHPATARVTSSFPTSHSDTPVLQAQGCLGGASLLPVSFQEGRRASDTSLTQGNYFLPM